MQSFNFAQVSNVLYFITPNSNMLIWQAFCLSKAIIWNLFLTDVKDKTVEKKNDFDGIWPFGKSALFQIGSVKKK